MWKNTTWNVLGLLIPSIVAIPVMAFMARILGVEKFGLYMLAFSLIGYSGIFDGGLTRAVIRSVAMNDGDKEKDRVVIGTATWTVLALAVVACSIVYFFAADIVNMLNVTTSSIEDARMAFKYLAFNIPLFLLSLIWFAYPEGRQNFLSLNIYKTLSGVLVALLPLIAIINDSSLSSAIRGLLVARIIAVALAFIPCRAGLGFRFFIFRWKELKKLLGFGGWITLSNIISPLMVYADRFILSNILGASLVAFYTAPSEAIARMSIIPGAVSRTIFPLLSKSQTNAAEVTKKAFHGLLLASLLMAIPVFLLAKPILIIWLGEAYGQDSSVILQILLFGFVFNSIAQIPYSKIQANGHARLTAMIHLFELVPYLLVLATMIYFYGLTGAAVAWSLRVTVDFLILDYCSRRLST